ncbi:MAG: phosphatase PAP2 family protein [Ferrimicrobium sp.]|jgi:undecaprenyl-diphosphatase|uniref:Phosphatase PAP2 family protein n=1 Tax=Ferrimicrobium acidiphilum TaxID=121039 RepID=A0ABV3Y5D7_9ACTN|nr:phosphatase PAP2 family protein [Ferrimicrobium sp.]
MPEIVTLNRKLYLDVNHFAVSTPWAHAFMAGYSHLIGIGLLALLLLVAWFRARSRPDPQRRVAKVLWAAGGTTLAEGISHYVLKPLIAERRPYLTLAHVEVLLTRTNGYSFPSGHATIAGATIVGLWLSRDKLLTVLAFIVGIMLAFGRVYVGMHYPGDVVAGLIFGGLFVLVLSPPAVRLLTRFTEWLSALGTFGWLVASHRANAAHRVSKA